MIISASRRTDIPAFYSDWFLNRLQKGFVYVANPMNPRQISRVSLTPDNVECIVFWTKNPKPILPKLKTISSLGYKFYFQFTLTAYDRSIEECVPSKKTIIKTFKELSSQLGKNRVIWRYDPIFISEKISVQYHEKWFTYLAKELSDHTDKCIISFIDMYKKCERNMRHLKVKPVSDSGKMDLSRSIYTIAKNMGIAVESCAEPLDLKGVGVNHGKCIDDKLISQMINCEVLSKKDRHQRNECRCIKSIDIGAYNSCRHYCRYCYANFNKESVEKNIIKHTENSPLLIGDLKGNEKITVKKMSVLKSKQQLLF